MKGSSFRPPERCCYRAKTATRFAKNADGGGQVPLATATVVYRLPPPRLSAAAPPLSSDDAVFARASFVTVAPLANRHRRRGSHSPRRAQRVRIVCYTPATTIVRVATPSTHVNQPGQSAAVTHSRRKTNGFSTSVSFWCSFLPE